MTCPKCGNDQCTVINEVHTTGKDFSATQGCCGWILLGPLGILCGACGQGKQTHNQVKAVCNQCGTKFNI